MFPTYTGNEVVVLRDVTLVFLAALMECPGNFWAADANVNGLQ